MNATDGDRAGAGQDATTMVSRFGLEQLTDGERSIVNPAEAMHAWGQLPWFSEPAPSAALQRAA